MVSDMGVIMAVDMEVMVSDSDTEAMDMVMDREATTMPDTTWARDPLMPNPKLMPDICMEDMVLAMVAMDTDVDTDTVLDTPVDTDTVLVDTEATAMVCGEDKHSAHFPLELSSRNCQLLIACLRTSHPLIRNHYLTFVESRIWRIKIQFYHTSC